MNPSGGVGIGRGWEGGTGRRDECDLLETTPTWLPAGRGSGVPVPIIILILGQDGLEQEKNLVVCAWALLNTAFQDSILPPTILIGQFEMEDGTGVTPNLD